ncbi:MAG: response regulator [Candidatus Moraniibacteriota bacterium]
MPKILLVEDDPFIAEIYTKKLAGAGFVVETAASGHEVLKKVPEAKYDLMLLDLVLPEMGGMEVLREIKGKPSEYDPNLRIVVFSNLSSNDDREQALHAGADGFISKTEFTPTEVVDEVKRLLKQFSEQVKNVARAEGPGAEIVHPASTETKENGRRILLIEDEEVFAEMFGKRLTDDGYLVKTEGNGVKALEEALAHPYDLILMDVMLPGMEGRELIGKLRSNEGAQGVPIFLLTASLDDMEIGEVEKEKLVDRVLQKTKITPSELTDVVNEFFEKK